MAAPFELCECGKPFTDTRWCKSCNAKRFEVNFPNWTSGDEKINELIQSSQRDAESVYTVLEWIDWGKFSNVEKIGEGGFSRIYKAKWSGGDIRYWDQEKNDWDRDERETVALKTLSSLKDKTINLNEVEATNKCLSPRIESLRTFGITRDPTTREYMLVIEFAGCGDLRQYTRQEFANVTWEDRFKMLSDIAEDLSAIHEAGYMHRDLHCGNVLQVTKDFSNICDLGLCDTQAFSRENEVIGVMPYVAPEVLRRKPYTLAADIYSFGVIMWEITSGEPPFCNMPHDIDLALKICGGLRPEPVKGTPKLYLELMERCWNEDPDKRPTAKDIKNLLSSYKQELFLEFKIQLKKAEEIRRKQVANYRPPSKLEIHPSAFYTSRILPSVTYEIHPNTETQEYKTRQPDAELAIPSDGIFKSDPLQTPIPKHKGADPAIPADGDSDEKH